VEEVFDFDEELGWYALAWLKNSWKCLLAFIILKKNSQAQASSFAFLHFE